MKTSYYPRPEPKIPFPKEDADNVEALSQQFVSIIETVTDSTLYMGRDLQKLAAYLSEVTKQACQAYSSGKDLVGAEGIHAVLDPDRNEIAGALDLIAPEVRKQATLVFPRLVEVEYDFYEGFEGVPPRHPAVVECATVRGTGYRVHRGAQGFGGLRAASKRRADNERRV
ncbi:MAG: hypothetical protein EXQ88_01520 [Alphaproteobacteria bacterium]|nr:hypothetical protein [Alphaproteobacteria bacterium]